MTETKATVTKNTDRNYLEDYKGEEYETTMMRKRDNWAVPGPETCAVCEIVL